jgi:uncharacterized repeat protein (TIGR03803 family)
MVVRRLTPVVAVGLAIAAFAPPAAAATETVLYSFTSSATGYPLGSVYFAKSALFGACAANGHAGNNGQIFKLAPSGGGWKETSPLVFDGSDGSEPYPGPIPGPNGVLFGTTATGDAYGGGDVYELRKSKGNWSHTTIWAFGGRPDDGISPTADLVMDQAGNLYGTTYSGGVDGLGTVFELSNSTGVWSETILHKFVPDGKDGAEPYAGLLMAGAGMFYGTTTVGGRYGYGTVFVVYQSGGKWKEQVLHAFTGGADGSEPWGALVTDKNGILYGTTAHGGVSSGYSDVGTVFELVPSGNRWKEKVLHDFGAKGDGWDPLAGVRWGRPGQLYGTTSEGGSPGPGTVFELVRSGGVWTEKVLHSFGGSGDGNYPQGDVTFDGNDALYGTTAMGGAENRGTVWRVRP